jgi:hypothetical protein
MACDRLCSTLWQQRRWMVLLVAYSLAEALQSSARACGSWFSRVYRDFLVREPRIYTVDEHMYVWRTPILCSPSSFSPSTLLYFHKYNATRVGWLSSNRRGSRCRRRDAEKNLTIFGDEKSWWTRLVILRIALIVTVQGLYFLSLQ